MLTVQEHSLYRYQPRPIPLRIYEPNIIHNPFTWMGIWTPHGWRVHKKRWGKATHSVVTLSGDGHTTFFPEALVDPKTRIVGWQDDLHNRDDPFTDGGIYPCDPRVEYPVGQPRWAVSHTLLCYPVADHGLYTHEYTWDMTHGHLQTHFRQHVRLEQARTDSDNGKTVRVNHTPISRTIEGNVHYPLTNSAVRGVWPDKDKHGPNLYTRRITQLISMHNGGYAIAPRTPVVQCHGMYQVIESDPTDATVFDPQTGECVDPQRLIEQFLIPLDEPRLGMIKPSMRMPYSSLYESEIAVPGECTGVIDEGHLKSLTQRLGTTYKPGLVGYAYAQEAGQDFKGYRGYDVKYDINGDGVIDERDLECLKRNLGRRVRFNLYVDAYFGGDWLSTCLCLDPEHRPGKQAIADYEYGGGYDAQAGIIHLLDSPGPDQPVWVEYHYDAPAEAGENNIRVHLYHEIG